MYIRLKEIEFSTAKYLFSLRYVYAPNTERLN